MSLSTLPLIINIEDEGRKGLLQAFSSRSTRSVFTPFRYDKLNIDLRCVKPSVTSSRPWDDVDVTAAAAANKVQLVIGKANQAVTAGTFDLAFGGSTSGLTGLAYNISASALQTALNAVSAVSSAGGVTVAKLGNGYKIRFNTTGDKAAITSPDNALSPAGYVHVATFAGSSTAKEVVILEISERPYALLEDWTASAAASVTCNRTVNGGGGANTIQEIALTPGTYGGTYNLALTAGGVSRTLLLQGNATAAQIAATLATHPGMLTTDVSVTGETGGPFTVEFIGALANTSIAAMTVSNVATLAPLSHTGVLTLATENLYSAFAETSASSLSAVLQLKVTDPDDDDAGGIFLSVPISLQRDIVNNATLAPGPYSAGAQSSGGGTWGSITGTLSNQTDLNSALAAKVPTTTTISAAGLATGGGSLASNRTITVTAASQAEAEAGTATTVAMTPQRTAQAIAALANPTIKAPATYSTAGTTTFSDANWWHKATIPTGSFTRKFVLLRSGRTAREKAAILFEIAAGSQVIEVRDNDASSGAVLLRFTADGSDPARGLAEFIYNGSAWEPYSANVISTYTADSTAPTISTYSPADNATGVTVSANLVMTWSEAVTPQSGKNLTIKKTSDNSTIATISVTSGQVTGGGTNTITVNPSADLAAGTEFYVLLDAGAFKDAAGNDSAAITSTTAWSFTTASGSEAAFSFSGFTTPTRYYSAASVAGQSDGTAIQTLADLSQAASNAAQSTSDNRATKQTLGGKAVLRFDGTNDYYDLAAAVVPATENYTVIAVLKAFDLAAAKGGVVLGDTTEQAQALGLGDGTGASTGIYALDNSGTNLAATSDTPATQSALCVVAVMVTAGTGAGDGEVQFNFNGTTSAGTNLSAFGSVSIGRIGAPQSAAGFFKGDLAMLAIYDDEIADLPDLIDAIKTHYSIA